MSWDKTRACASGWLTYAALALVMALFVFVGDCDGQSSPGFISGQTLTATQLNSAFTGKVDLTNTTLTGALQKTQNLGDLTNVSAARTNLGLGSAATHNIATSGANVPLLNGANLWSNEATFSQNTSALPSPITGSGVYIGAADTISTRLQLAAFGTSSNVTVSRADGTAASPTGVLALEQIGSFNAWAWGSGAWQGPVASVRPYAAENIDSTHHGSKACMATTPTGSTTLTDSLCQQPSGGVTIGSPTGGDKGAGAINAAGLFQNGATAATLNSGSVQLFQASASGSIAEPVGAQNSAADNATNEAAFDLQPSATGCKAFVSGYRDGAANNTGLRLDTCSAGTRSVAVQIDHLQNLTLGGTGTTSTFRGHYASTGSAPAVSSCGGSPSIVASSTDQRGTVSNGSGTPSACTLTFSFDWSATPVCQITLINGGSIVGAVDGMTSAHQLVADFSSGFGGSWNYNCVG
jgi:hypothetical protein